MRRLSNEAIRAFVRAYLENEYVFLRLLENRDIIELDSYSALVDTLSHHIQKRPRSLRFISRVVSENRSTLQRKLGKKQKEWKS